MHIYISGPITGTADYIRRFTEAENTLLKMGYSPINPVSYSPVGESWEYYMRQDIMKLMYCDSIYMLKGWRRSKGARLEYKIAREMGFKIIYEH